MRTKLQLINLWVSCFMLKFGVRSFTIFVDHVGLMMGLPAVGLERNVTSKNIWSEAQKCWLCCRVQKAKVVLVCSVQEVFPPGSVRLLGCLLDILSCVSRVACRARFVWVEVFPPWSWSTRSQAKLEEVLDTCYNTRKKCLDVLTTLRCMHIILVCSIWWGILSCVYCIPSLFAKKLSQSYIIRQRKSFTYRNPHKHYHMSGRERGPPGGGRGGGGRDGGLWS